MFNKRLLIWLISLSALSTVMIALGIIWGRLFDTPDFIIYQDMSNIYIESPLYIMRTDGKHLKQLTDRAYPLGNLAISPDQTHFAFIASANGENYLFVQTIASGEQVQLTEKIGDLNLNAQRVSWSPDGTRIAFVARDRTKANNDIYIINADGSNFINLTNSSTSEYTPVWSPTSETILYQSFPGGRNELNLINADGSGYQTLTSIGNTGRLIPGLAWSPDGTQIAYLNGNNFYTMNADGTNQRQIGSAPNVSNLHWFPNDQLVFHSPYDGWALVAEHLIYAPLLDLNLPAGAVFAFSPLRQPFLLKIDTPPVADAGEDQTVVAANGTSAQVTLDGSNSYDSDGTITSHLWMGAGSVVYEGSIITVTLGVGVHEVTLLIHDDRGNNVFDQVTITVLAPD